MKTKLSIHSVTPSLKDMILSLIFHRPQYRKLILFLALRMIQRVLVIKKHTLCSFKLLEKSTPSVAFGVAFKLTIIGEREVTIICSKEMVIIG